MNFSFPNSEFAPALVIASMFIGAVYALFWMVVGFRAMRAHERLAEATMQLAREARRDRGE